MTKIALIAAFLGFAIVGGAAAQTATMPEPQLNPDAARKMVDACLAYAQQNHILVGVAVVNASGLLIDFHVMDGGGPTLAETAILKAKTAAHFRRPTGELEEQVLSGGNQAPIYMGYFPKKGALPIVIDGQTVGAIGIGGAAKQEECARAGIEAVLGKQQASAR
jgi:glc operon protein GlcG